MDASLSTSHIGFWRRLNREKMCFATFFGTRAEHKRRPALLNVNYPERAIAQRIPDFPNTSADYRHRFSVIGIKSALDRLNLKARMARAERGKLRMVPREEPRNSTGFSVISKPV